jgi:hypothetical protein
MRAHSLMIAGLVASLSGIAFAQEEPVAEDVAPVSDAPDGQYSVMRGVQGAKGMFSARVLLHMNLSSDQVGKPVSLAPDLYYSVTDKFQLGLLHNGPMGFQTRPGAGICFTGEENGCPKVYDNLGLDAMYGLLYGKAHLSAHATFYINSFDPSQLAIALGAVGKLHFTDAVALFFDPQVSIALNKRDAGNEDVFWLPIELQGQVSAPLAVKLLTGIYGPFDGFGDAFQVPVGVGAVYNINPMFDVGLRFSFDNLLGKVAEGVGRADARSIALLFHIRA